MRVRLSSDALPVAFDCVVRHAAPEVVQEILAEASRRIAMADARANPGRSAAASFLPDVSALAAPGARSGRSWGGMGSLDQR